jgi:hypothetical protein
MNKIQINYTLAILIILVSIISPNQWNMFAIGNTTTSWIISFSVIIVTIFYISNFFNPYNKKDYIIVKIYFFWMIMSCIRGILIAENYWEWKQLIAGSLSLSLPVFVYVFSNPSILYTVLKLWIKYSIPLFCIFFVWALYRDAYQFYLGPVLLLSCFLPILDKKWQLIFITLLLLMIFADWGARSQVVKALVCFGMSAIYIMVKYLSYRILKIAHWFLYLLPIILLTLGLTGQFNIFKDLASSEDKYVERKIVDGQLVEENLSADTRTFIYVEVIESALKHGYVIWGRSPARGNDSNAFGTQNAEELKTGKYERHNNEVCFTNIFTWLGLVGMILYCLIYLKASYLAVYKSNNIFIKLVGIFIAFRFTYGWVEDINRFDIMNISIWMAIAMGYSEQFRRMNDMEFKLWLKAIFVKKNIKKGYLIVN